jgi:hypothetical protein
MTRVHSSPAQLLYGHHSSAVPDAVVPPLADHAAQQQQQQQQQQQTPGAGVESSGWDAKTFAAHGMMHCSSDPCIHHQPAYEDTSDVRTSGGALAVTDAPAASAAIAAGSAAAASIAAFDVTCKVEAADAAVVGAALDSACQDMLLQAASAEVEAGASGYPVLTGFGSMYSATAPGPASGSDDAGAGTHLQAADQTLMAMSADLAAAAAAAHAAQAELASLAASDPAAAAAVGRNAALGETNAGAPKAAVTSSKKQSTKGKKGTATSGKGPGAASTVAVGKGAASGQKRKAEQPPAAKQSKASKSSDGQTARSEGAPTQPKVQRYIKDMMELRQQVSQLPVSLWQQ